MEVLVKQISQNFPCYLENKNKNTFWESLGWKTVLWCWFPLSLKFCPFYFSRYISTIPPGCFHRHMESFSIVTLLAGVWDRRYQIVQWEENLAHQVTVPKHPHHVWTATGFLNRNPVPNHLKPRSKFLLYWKWKGFHLLVCAFVLQFQWAPNSLLSGINQMAKRNFEARPDLKNSLTYMQRV